MIFMLQNLLHYTYDYMFKDQSKLSSSKYPTQNTNIINKLLFVPYRDENQVLLNYRLYIPDTLYPQFNGHSGPYDNFTKVLRFDMEEPYVAILVDENDYIIVADSRELLNYKLYPGYQYTKDFRGFTEAHLDTMTETWSEFNEAYNAERIWDIHVQNWTYVGVKVYVEYFDDILHKPHDFNILEPDPIDHDLSKRMNRDFLNRPLRTSETGYVIRADENGNEGSIVVMVINEETGERKYVLGTEAFFYFKSTDEKVNIKDLNIWQVV